MSRNLRPPPDPVPLREIARLFDTVLARIDPRFEYWRRLQDEADEIARRNGYRIAGRGIRP